jgi:RimJ/RimL family protein N-acetyltransferase
VIDYIYGHDDVVAQFVSQLIPEVQGRGFGASRAIGVVNDEGQLIAGIVYHNYDPPAGVMEMSGACLPGANWLTRETLKRIYQYPFLHCGCQMVLMRVAAENERLLRLLAAKNFSFIRIPRLRGHDKDAIVCLLTREAWEGNKFCKRFGHHQADKLPRDVLDVATRKAA